MNSIHYRACLALFVRIALVLTLALAAGAVLAVVLTGGA